MCGCGATLQAQSDTVNAAWPVISSSIPALTSLFGTYDPVYAIADEDLERSDEVKTSAVHFLRFELPRNQVVALKADAALAAGIDHENYLVEVSPVAENTRGALLADLD